MNCSIRAAARVMGVSVEKLIEKIGHDGSAKHFPELPEPLCRAGFHIQEIQDVAIKLGWRVITVELMPQATPDGINIRSVFTEDKIKERWAWYLNLFNGIVLGQKIDKEIWHYNVWLNGLWFDTDGRYLVEPNITISYFYAFEELNST